MLRQQVSVPVLEEILCALSLLDVVVPRQQVDHLLISGGGGHGRWMDGHCETQPGEMHCWKDGVTLLI